MDGRVAQCVCVSEWPCQQQKLMKHKNTKPVLSDPSHFLYIQAFLYSFPSIKTMYFQKVSLNFRIARCALVKFYYGFHVLEGR